MVTGLGYSTDLIVIFTGGVLGSIAVCSPFILADGLARANGTIVQGCVNSVSPKLLEGLNPKMCLKQVQRLQDGNVHKWTQLLKPFWL